MLCHRCRVAATATRRIATLRAPNAAIPAASARVRIAPRCAILPRLQSPPSRRYSTPSEDSSAEAAASPAAKPKTGSLEKPDYLDEAESAIWDRLVAEFAPTELQVQDISGGCGSMYGIEIASEKFRGANMVKQQRMVNAILRDEMKGWHGLQLRTKVP